ncbi:MAG: 4-alpha-glucanotransferase [Blastocatellia bacterium]|nr:4-alpha-glucanotransferase [Blastocatellia bacterium]
MESRRASGILLHPTSLPGAFGIGDLGKEAFKFIDFLVKARQTYWQVLPLGPTGWGDSPYASFSAFAGNSLLISPEQLVEDGLLPEHLASGEGAIGNVARVDYGAIYQTKTELLRSAFETWRGRSDRDFETFAAENASWLDDYAIYRAIKMSQGQRAWYDWEEQLKLRDENALHQAAENLSDEVLAQKFYQFQFYKQWWAVKRYANEKGVRIVGDVPIFAALDSADVWRHREQFKLNVDGSPRAVSGVPPDFFSKTGQLWGNPIYDWDVMHSNGFSWWIDRLRWTLKMVDIIRIDHFRGFQAAWEVPGGEPTAENGEWVDARGRELFTGVQKAIGDLPFWVEDLGFMTADVDALRDDFGFPGMRILQFAFGGDAGNQALPHNYIRNCIAYTGTHDNDTTVGWWNAQPSDGPAREHCTQYLGGHIAEINWELVRAVWGSVADTAIVPMQDLLGLDNAARMNRPATTDGNWQWRFAKGDLTDELSNRLKELTEVYGRSLPL